MKKKAVSALIWSGAGQFGSTGISTIFVLIFAHFVSPAEFGIFAICTMVLTLSFQIAGLGLGTALVQRDTLDTKALSTAFWMSVGTAVILAALLIALSGPISSLFDEPTIRDMIAPMMFVLVIRSATGILTASLVREMNIRAMTNRTLVANLVSGLVATPLALNGYGAVALVTQVVAVGILMLILTLRLTGLPVRLQFDRSTARDLLRFGIPVMKSDFLNVFNVESPKFFVGLFLGTTALGIYSMANRLLSLLMMLLGATLSSVAYPLLSEVNRTTPERVHEVHLRLLKLASTAFLPVFLLCAVLSEELILIALGPQWTDAGPLLMFLFLAGIPMSLGYLNGATAMAIGKPELRYRFILIGAVIGTLLLAVATQFGVIWVGVALLLRSVIAESLLMRGVLKLAGTSLPRGLSVLKAAGLAGITLVVLAILIQTAVADASVLSTVAVVVGGALAGFAVVIWLMDRDVVREIGALVRNRSAG